MNKLKQIFKSIGEDWNELPRSVRFWNSMVLLGLIISGIYSYDLLLVEFFIGSILIVSLAIDGDLDNQLWGLFMPITWICVLLVGIGALLTYIYQNTIQKFNNWLNRE